MKRGVKWTALLGALMLVAAGACPAPATAGQGGFSSVINNIWYIEDGFYLTPLMGTTWTLYYYDTSTFPYVPKQEILVVTDNLQINDIGAALYCYTTKDDGWLYFYKDLITGDHRYFAVIDGVDGTEYFALAPGGATLTGAYLSRSAAGVEYAYNHLYGKRTSGPVVPVAPTLVVDTNGTIVTLYWNDLLNAQGFNLYFEPAVPYLPFAGQYYPFDGGFSGVLDVGKRTSLTFVLPVGSCFYVGIQGYNEGGNGGLSNVVAFYLQ